MITDTDFLQQHRHVDAGALSATDMVTVTGGRGRFEFNNAPQTAVQSALEGSSTFTNVEFVSNTALVQRRRDPKLGGPRHDASRFLSTASFGGAIPKSHRQVWSCAAGSSIKRCGRWPSAIRGIVISPLSATPAELRRTLTTGATALAYIRPFRSQHSRHLRRYGGADHLASNASIPNRCVRGCADNNGLFAADTLTVTADSRPSPHRQL